MTAEEAQKLKEGDVVYYRGGDYRPNAIVLADDAELVRTVVAGVTPRHVKTPCSSVRFDSLMSESDGLAAIEAFKARARKFEDDARRVKVAGERIHDSGFDVVAYSNEIKVSAWGPDAAERMADLLELAHRAMVLREQLSAALPIMDAPAGLLPLSLAQAEQVLAVLKGGE